jgi:hypothetical protein
MGGLVREAAAQPKTPTKEAMEEARTRYARGTELYNDGAYEQAMLEFERAYSLAPAYRILFNIAQVAVLLRDYPKAIRAYEQFLKDGGQRIPADRRKTVEEELQSLRGRVGRITIKVNVPDAEVLVDDLVIGRSPLQEPMMVTAGRHMVIARKRGLVQDSESVVLAGTDEVNVELELTEPPTSTAPVTPPAPREPDQPTPPREPSYVWAGWVVTGALAAGAVATGIATFYSTRKLDDMKDTFGITRAELDEQESTARALGIAADVLIASAVVAGGITLYFTIDEALEDDATETKVEAGVGPGQVTLRARF